MEDAMPTREPKPDQKQPGQDMRDPQRVRREEDLPIGPKRDVASPTWRDKAGGPAGKAGRRSE
jgi:hypothetical protein